MSQWRYKLDEDEQGPVSFQQLAELVREGKIAEGALVCRAGTMNWEPAWHVPGLLRAAGIVEPGDSPEPVVQMPTGETGAANGLPTLPGYVPAVARPPRLTLADVVRGMVAAAIGVLAVGFFYRWAYQATLAFPLPPTVVDGETIDCYFPMVGRCSVLECGLLYVDVFAVAAAAMWHAVGGRQTGKEIVN